MNLPLLLLLAMQGYSPETEAVMNRSRAEAAAKRGETVAPAPASALPLPPAIAAKLQACLDAATQDPDAGVRFANDWRIDGGSFHARQCLGFAYAKAERWAPAMIAFEQAADEAERAGEKGSGRLWAQAGNAALAGGDAAKARGYFDAAFARGLPAGLEKGEIHLDRARALVALNDLPAARTDIDAALTLAAPDPLAWLLSATLARRMNELSLAQRHIAQAVKLAPDDASVALEEGAVAVLTGHDDVARSAWQRAVKLAPESDAGKAAAANLAQLGAG